ncbi:ribulose bisphosphate carboxylase/oxygenase activase 2, chloroplastic [Zea mays]|uniref:Ribulose bisphosphate carboxylase/oxygenase activase, chloroplastic n=1 Tax=Zea mays TaxID=4577 RepID=A0A804M8Z4_MAIZE|nr:ribulose bisphosphate carboxylase/oxygenase activase 2, chloroplastic [Zea mays]|eukprot:XP_020403676.1 ribulose bisphosphate carboxylase/oxygenase activase 2, chloroplastic [Zea mays]
MATTSVAASSPHPHLSRPRRRNSSATSRTSIRGCLLPIRCSSASSSQPPATGGEEGESGRRRLSKQSSWEDRDVEGDDYLYRLGKEADNLNITVGARSGIVDELFVGNFLGKDSDIVFDYRQKATRTFEYLQGDYYIAPAFLDKVACHIVKNYIAHLLNNIKVPLILGIWGGKGQGKTFQTELIFRAMGVEPVIMSAGELESEKAGEPGRLIRDRYRTASQVIQNQGKMSCLMINDLDAGVGRFGNTQMTVNNQIAVGTLMNLADNPTRVSIGQKWRESDVTHRVPIIVTGNDFSTLYAPLIRDGRMEKFYWQPNREDIISIVHGMYIKDGLSVEEVSRIVDAFPNQALDFYGALRSRTYDQAILEWVEEIGGHEQLNEKLLKRKKGEELPTFIPPKPTLEALIESGYSLVKEQELIMSSKLSKEYMKNLE